MLHTDSEPLDFYRKKQPNDWHQFRAESGTPKPNRSCSKAFSVC
jgi:hypothetical protein